MAPQYMKCLLASRTSAKGFTLLEMIVGIALTVSVSGLALAALSNAERGFSKDKNVIEGGQKLSSVIDIVGRDITQAGEEINDPRFPVIQVIRDPEMDLTKNTGSKIIIYRGLEEALSLCSSLPVSNALTAGTSTSSLPLTSTNNGVQLENSSCIPAPVPAPPAFGPTPIEEYPNNIQAWRDQRTAKGGQMSAVLHDGSGTIQLVTLTGETNVDSFHTLGGLSVSPFTPSVNFPNRSTLNLVEKHEYLVCDNNLKVRTNVDSNTLPCSDTTNLQTIATNITKLDISMATSATPDPLANIDFPSGTLSWRNLRGVTVNITARNPDIGINSSAPDISAAGRFYPRNILSTNVQ
jgi:prepilin-type N-terminal cleavage/methylation domain-containing protein